MFVNGYPVNPEESGFYQQTLKTPAILLPHLPRFSGSAQSQRHASRLAEDPRSTQSATRVYIAFPICHCHSGSPVMPSPSSLLLALLLTALQLALSVDAKGGGKGSKGSKSSKKKSKTKTKVPPVEYYRANGKCYNNQCALLFLLTPSLSPPLDTRHVEIRCPARKKTALIVGIVIAVIAGQISFILNFS